MGSQQGKIVYGQDFILLNEIKRSITFNRDIIKGEIKLRYFTSSEVAERFRRESI